MSFLPENIQTALISQFRGAVTSSDSYAVDPAHSLYCRNCSFTRGNSSLSQVQTRLGHAQVVQFPNGDGTITSAYNWYFTSGGTLYSLFMYYAPTVGGKYYNSTGGFASIFSVTGAAGAVYVGAGNRIYAAFYNSTGQIGSAGAQVYGWGVGTDDLFATPLTTPQPAAAGTLTPGSVTPGFRRVAYITTTRNGYTGPIQPVTFSGSSTQYEIDPIGLTTYDSNQFTVTVTLASLPSYLSGGSSALQVVMTTVANINRWYAVPGAVVTPVVGVNTFTIDISDDALAATAVDVTDRLNLLVSNGSTHPFTPVSIFKYSARLGYCTIDLSGAPVVYVSNKNDFQYVTADQHGIYLEGEAIPVAGVSLQSNLYIAATTGLYNTVDNGDVPSTWSSPTRVDGSVGIPSPTCLLENSTSGYVIVASPGSGLFLFGGSVFPELPLSYHQQSDWNRINWALPTKIQLCEDVLTKKFLVSVPMRCDISGITYNSGSPNPITVTTSQPHLMQVGLSITITGVVGTTNANTTADIITAPTANTFTINVAGNAAYVSGGVVTPNAANCVMSWDYTEGFDPDQVKYCLRSFTSFRIGAITRVLNTANAVQEVWYGAYNSNPGNVIRQVMETDATPYRDVDMSGTAAAINSWYQTSNLPGSQDESTTLHDFTGMNMRVKGSGNLVMAAYNLDGTRTVTPARSPLALSTTPAQEPKVLWQLRSEQQTIGFGTNAVDEYFIMALIRAYYAESMPQR